MGWQTVRKVPVEVRAIRWDGEAATMAAVREVDSHVSITTEGKLLIPTLEGTMTADRGDWIIQGVQGEVYPCKPDIFDATYELLGDQRVAADIERMVGDADVQADPTELTGDMRS